MTSIRNPTESRVNKFAACSLLLALCGCATAQTGTPAATALHGDVATSAIPDSVHAKIGGIVAGARVEARLRVQQDMTFLRMPDSDTILAGQVRTIRGHFVRETQDTVWITA